MTMITEPTDKHFYGRRKLRPLRKAREEALDIAAEQFMLPETLLQQQQIDPRELLGMDKIWFEIGFGAGEHMVGQAARHPETGFIGCEPFINGVSQAAKDIVDGGLKNVRIWMNDALPLLSRFPDACLDRVFLLFPDPWPKTKHHKRRFIQLHTLDVLARVLKPGAQLRLATDDANLAQWMLLHTVQHELFGWNDAANADWRSMPNDWVETRYQQKAAQQGRLAHYVNFTRKEI